MKTKEFVDRLQKFVKEYELREADLDMLTLKDGTISCKFNFKLANSDQEIKYYADFNGDDIKVSFTHYNSDPNMPGSSIPILPEEVNKLREANKIAESNETTYVNIPSRDISMMNDIDNGMTFAEASREYGISPSRVAECYARAKRRYKFRNIENDASVIDFREYALLNLSVRTYNAIIRAGIIDYDIFLSKTDYELSHIRGLGPLSLAQLHVFKENILKDRTK